MQLSRCKKGSRGFEKSVAHRKNFVNWSVNQLNLGNVGEVRRENIKNLRRGKRTSKFLSHWAYTEIFEKLDRFCEEQGVLVTKINPAYTSQMCPQCKTLGNRRGKKFTCSCGYKNDADLTAAINLSGKPIVSRENVFL
jgi:putative transposase